jgi:acetoin utilization protein AcuB
MMAVELDNLHHMPTIKVAMTPFPFFVDIDARVAEALSMMRENDIHHLPVTEDGALIGVLSARDIRLLEVARRGQSNDLGTVRDACVRDVYVVDVDTPLDEVLLALADSHRGAALVVMKNGKLAGILTTSDACRLLADLLQQRFPAPPDGDAAA